MTTVWYAQLVHTHLPVQEDHMTMPRTPAELHALTAEEEGIRRNRAHVVQCLEECIPALPDGWAELLRLAAEMYPVTTTGRHRAQEFADRIAGLTEDAINCLICLVPLVTTACGAWELFIHRLEFVPGLEAAREVSQALVHSSLTGTDLPDGFMDAVESITRRDRIALMSGLLASLNALRIYPRELRRLAALAG